jgi:hypothetical protein
MWRVPFHRLLTRAKQKEPTREFTSDDARPLTYVRAIVMSAYRSEADMGRAHLDVGF